MQASAERQFKGARPTQETVERAYTFADLSAYPLKKRFLIRAADLGFFVLIKLIGLTVRFEVRGMGKLRKCFTQWWLTHLYLLAQPCVSSDLLLAAPAYRRDDFAEFRWRVHRAVHTKIRLWLGARFEYTRRRWSNS